MASLILLLLCVGSWLVSATGKGRDRQKNRRDCDDVDSASNTLFSSNLCGELILPTDEEAYLVDQEQYATSTFPERTKPSMIVTPYCDEDIKLAIAYAEQCAYTVTIRSGGHQYSGLSSCNSSCIQIDMAAYDHIEISNDTAHVSAGPCVRLGDFFGSLSEQELTLPGGTCSEVALGGHVQTGGAGHTIRSQGYLLDHVVAFDIILSNGESHHVIKPGKVRSSKMNDDLFWAVLGGSPGAWGVVTNYEFMADRDSDFSPMVAVCRWMYDSATMKDLAENFIDISQNDDFVSDPNHGIWVTATKAEPLSSDIIIAHCLWHGIDNEPYNSTFCDMLFDSALAMNPAAQCEHMEIPTSTAFTSVWTWYFEREFPFPYVKAVRSANVVDAEFATSFVDRLDEIFSDPNGESGVFMVMEMIASSGMRRFDPISASTSISHRDQVMTLVTDLFYAESLNENAYATSAQWQKDAWGEWLGTGIFNDGVDERPTWSTFGSIDIEAVLPFYYEPELYERLKRIKKRVDPSNVFQTPFTIPVDSDGRRGGNGAKYQRDGATALDIGQNVIRFEISPAALVFVVVVVAVMCAVSLWICGSCSKKKNWK